MTRYQVKPQQHLGELAEFLDFVKSLAPRSYCEIGCKFGGLLWKVAGAMPPKSKLVAVDLPNSHWGRSESEGSLRECVRELKRAGHDAHLIMGDSTSAPVIDAVEKAGPFDLIFIDANHTEKYVRRDFQHYGVMGKVICFHDIAWNNPTPPNRMAIEVPKVWAEIKEANKGTATFHEIKLDTKWNEKENRHECHNGIGILTWR